MEPLCLKKRAPDLSRAPYTDFSTVRLPPLGGAETGVLSLGARGGAAVILLRKTPKRLTVRISTPTILLLIAAASAIAHYFFK